MRDILFKGKKISDGKWIEGFFVQRKGKCYICANPYEIMEGYSSEKGQHYGFGDFYEVDPETVCRYTGMTDKNGKKIWEGDIVTFNDSITINGSKTHYSAVEWVVEFSSFLIHADCIGYYSVNPAQVKQYEMEVVGNIFDNPNLLNTSSTDSD